MDRQNQLNGFEKGWIIVAVISIIVAAYGVLAPDRLVIAVFSAISFVSLSIMMGSFVRRYLPTPLGYLSFALVVAGMLVYGLSLFAPLSSDPHISSASFEVPLALGGMLVEGIGLLIWVAAGASLRKQRQQRSTGEIKGQG